MPSLGRLEGGGGESKFIEPFGTEALCLGISGFTAILQGQNSGIVPVNAIYDELEPRQFMARVIADKIDPREIVDPHVAMDLPLICFELI